jgi:hypothetical protein
MASRHHLGLALVVLTGCVAQDEPAETLASESAPSSPIVLAAPSPNISAIRLQRSGCYGSCPIYEVELAADGQVKYVGDKFVDEVGFRTSKILPSDFVALAERVGAIHFFDLKDRYRFEQDGCTSWVTDQPTATIVVTANGKDKVVSYYYGCRGLPIGPQLKALAQTIDKVTGTSQWIGAHGSAP